MQISDEIRFAGFLYFYRKTKIIHKRKKQEKMWKT